MQVRKLGIWRVTGLALCGVIALNVPAQALWEGCLWLHPCKNDPGTEQTCDPFLEPPLCWCEADWDDELNWTCFGIASGYPDLPSENARFRHSNTGYCNGGTRDGDPCSQDSDCPRVSCENFELYLELQLTTESIGGLWIETAATNATDEKLEIRFESKGNSAKTLTTLQVILDATNGPITLKISDSATLKTVGAG